MFVHGLVPVVWSTEGVRVSWCVFPQAPGFADVVLPTEMTSRVNQLVVSTRNTKNNSAPFRHILFYGPPGLLSGIARAATGWHSFLCIVCLCCWGYCPLRVYAPSVTGVVSWFDWFRHWQDDGGEAARAVRWLGLCGTSTTLTFVAYPVVVR